MLKGMGLDILRIALRSRPVVVVAASELSFEGC